MADNTRLNSGSGGDLMRTEDLGTVKINVGKIYTGAAGADGGPVTATNPFPVMLMSGTSSQGSVTNPFFVTGTLQSGSVAGLLVGGQAVAGNNPIPVILYSGSSAIGGSSNPLQVTGTLYMVETSGSVTGLLVGGVALSNANPLPVGDSGGSLTVDGSVTVLSGSVFGQLVGGVAVSMANPVPMLLVSGSDAYGSSTNPLYVTGSVASRNRKVNTTNKIKYVIPASATAVNIMSASLNNRTRGTIFNHGNASLHISFGETPTLNNFDVKIGSASYYELPTSPVWQDSITGIWDSANGFAMVNDFTGSF